MNKRIDKQQILVLTAAMVMLGGFAGFRYVPVLQQRQALAASIEQQSREMEEIRGYSSLLPELKSNKSTRQDSLIQFARRIPTGRDFARLWQQIADAMNACGLRDQWVQPGTETRVGQFCSIPLTVECKGSPEQLFSFIEAIEGLDRLICMEDIQLENSSDLNAELKMTAKAAVYYQPEAQ